jgi:hypothetical protein
VSSLSRRKTMKRLAIPVFLCGLALGMTPGTVLAEESVTASDKPETSAQEDSASKWSFWFYADETYRFRTTLAGDGDPIGDENDHDLRLFLESGFRDPSDRFGAEASLGLWWDVDGEVPEAEPSALASVTDYRQPWWDVFSLSADYRSTGILKLARVGRQVSEHGLPVTFDGGSIRLTAVKPTLDVFLFGGRSVHFFETRADMFEDWIGSIGTVIRPMPELRIELDYRFLQEDVLGDDRESKNERRDHSYGLSAWFRHGDWLYAKAYLRGLNDTVSHAGAGARMIWQRLGLGATINLDAQTTTLKEVNERQDPFFVLLGESLPHLRWRLDLFKEFDTAVGTYGIHAGWNGRNILEGDEGPFNRNMGKAYLQFTANDIGTKGPFLALAAEAHFTYEGSALTGDWIAAVGGSAGWDSKKFRAEIGSYYQAYKYDYYVDLREVADVRSYFASVSYKPLDWLGLKARYEFEQSDRDLHTVTFTVSQMY